MKKLLTTIGFILLPLTSQAAVATVQSSNVAPGSTGSALNFTISAPVAGNILVACTSWYPFAGSMNAPDGTWTQVDTGNINNDSVAVWWHPVLAGAGTTYNFFTSGGSPDWVSGVIYEFSGTSVTAPITQIASTTFSATNPITTNSLTPAVLSTKAVSCLATDEGSAAGGISLISVSSGWTEQQTAMPSFHSTFSPTRDALTSDTVTAISNTYTLSKNATGVSEIFLINPPTASVTVSAAKFWSWLNTKIWNNLRVY